MKAEIEERFRTNLARVEHFVATYTAVRDDMIAAGLRDGARGRATVVETDFLRAAVVFLHAALEDFVRSLLAWKLPIASGAALDEIPVRLGSKKVDKLSLAQVAQHRGLTLDDVVRASVDAWLDDSSFNHPGQIEDDLQRVGVAPAVVAPFKAYLGPMIQRRHLIVHRADRNMASGRGHHGAMSIGRDEVSAWVTNVRSFGEAVLAAIGDEASP
jgi:hypothetical protein